MAAQQAGPAALPEYLTKMGPTSAPTSPRPRSSTCRPALYVTDPASVPNKVAPGSVGTREGQSVVLLGGSAQSLFRDIKDGRLG